LLLCLHGWPSLRNEPNAPFAYMCRQRAQKMGVSAAGIPIAVNGRSATLARLELEEEDYISKTCCNSRT
jgi:hypothetical protein